MTKAMPEGEHFALYCPALGAFRRAAAQIEEHRREFFSRFEWIPLYERTGPADQVTVGLTLRAYFCSSEGAFYCSHRTMSQKAAQHPGLIELYAHAGAWGNETAWHVAPKD